MCDTTEVDIKKSSRMKSTQNTKGKINICCADLAMCVLFMISGGLGLQWLKVGLPFPSQRLSQAALVRTHGILATKPVVSDKGPAPSTLEKRIS